MESKQEPIPSSSHRKPDGLLQIDAPSEIPQTADPGESKSRGDFKREKLQTLTRARNVRAGNIETLSSQIRAGEYGLGSLVRQLQETQLAIQRREVEIGRLSKLCNEEMESQRDCEAAIRQLKQA